MYCNMLQPNTLASGLLCLLLTACAGGQGGYSDEEMGRLTARPKRLLTNEELRGNCPGLTVALRVHIDRLRELQRKLHKDQDWPPPTLMAMWEERPVATDIVKERERIAELNAALDGKGCKTLDVDEELRKSPPVEATKKTKR